MGLCKPLEYGGLHPRCEKSCLSPFRKCIGLTRYDQNIMRTLNSTKPKAKNINNISPACILFVIATQALDVIFLS